MDESNQEVTTGVFHHSTTTLVVVVVTFLCVAQGLPLLFN